MTRVYYELISRRRARVLRDHLAALIPPNARVLDVGCGDGLLASLIMEARPDVAISGIDVLKQPHARIPVTVYNGEAIPFPDGGFDVALFVDVLHHAAAPLALLREARRIARARVIIKDHNRDGFAAGSILRFMDWLGNSPYGIALPYNYWPERRWRATFAELGLTIVDYRARLGLYPAPIGWIFDRSLHFIALLDVRPNALDRSLGR